MKTSNSDPSVSDADDSILPSQNKKWGFWGTMETSKKAAWSLAMTGVAKATDQPPEAVRAFLDSRDGRYLADEVEFFLSQGIKISDAVCMAVNRWMAPAYKSGLDSFPAGTPYLTACILSVQAEAKSAQDKQCDQV